MDNVTLARWRTSTFVCLLVGYIGYYLCRANLSAAFPLLEQTFGYTNAQLGLIAFYSEIAYAAGKFITGPAADRLGGKKTFLIGIAGGIGLNLVFSQLSSLTMFIVAWSICRFFLSMGWAGLVKLIGAWYPPERYGTVMGLISISFQFGGVLAALFCGYLISQGASWRELFIYPALVLAVIGVGCSIGIRSPSKGIRSLSKRHGSLWRGSPLFRQILLFSFLTTFLRSIFLVWTPKILVDIGMGNSGAVFKSALFPLLGCVGTILLGWYTDRFTRGGNRAPAMIVMLVGLVFSLAGISVLLADGRSYQNEIVLLLGLSGFFLLGPYSMSAGCLTLDAAGADGAGSASGLVDGIGYAGGALATFLTGWMADQMGWREVFIALSGVSVLGVASAWRMGVHFKAAARTSGSGASSAHEVREDEPSIGVKIRNLATGNLGEVVPSANH